MRWIFAAVATTTGAHEHGSSIKDGTNNLNDLGGNES